MEKICWLVDELLTENSYESGYPSLEQAALEAGHRVHKTKYIPFSDKLFEDTKDAPFEYGECVVTHGTVQFCKQVEKHLGKWWTPGMYFNANVKSFSRFAAHIGEDLLNEGFWILPYGEFVRRREWGDWFIKPEIGLKEFTGQVICESTFGDDLKKLVSHGADIDLETLCVIAPVKDIKAEFRYVICDREVITGSEYRWDNVLDVRRDTHPICDAMANKIAKADWQADIVYVCDVALLSENTAKVIELNAFSSSGLYACDTYKIVEAVSKAALKEHSGNE